MTAMIVLKAATGADPDNLNTANFVDSVFYIKSADALFTASHWVMFMVLFIIFFHLITSFTFSIFYAINGKMLCIVSNGF